MNFPLTNPDVDCRSINQRLDRLERAFGISSSRMSRSFPDFDQFPENELSKTPNGLVLKYSADDFGLSTGLPEFNKVGLKLIVCWQFIPNSTATYQYMAIRFHVTSVVDYIAADRSTNIKPNVANLHLYEEAFSLNPSNQIEWLGRIKCKAIGLAGDANVQGPIANLGGFDLRFFNRRDWSIIILKGGATHPYYKAFPSYAYGASAIVLSASSYANLECFAGTSIANVGLCPLFTVRQPQDLPASSQRMYPKSWVS